MGSAPPAAGPTLRTPSTSSPSPHKSFPFFSIPLALTSNYSSLARIKSEKKAKQAQQKHRMSESRQHLANLRSLPPPFPTSIPLDLFDKGAGWEGWFGAG